MVTLVDSPEKLDPTEKLYYKRIVDFIKNVLKIDVSQYKPNYILRRLRVRLKATKCNSLKEYYEYLRTHKEEHEELAETLTVNVTEFWRDITVYKEIQKIIEGWVSDRTRRKIRIWSAGCSSGEEPYGIAIIVNEAMEKYKRKLLNVTIIGTDIDKEVLNKARRGVYHIKQLKNLPPNIIEKYFTKLNEEEYMIKPIVKKYVKFQYHDLIKDPPLKDMDMVLCRNVIIYFDKKVQEQIFLKFYEALNPGGFLVLGKTEILHGEAKKLFKTYNARERIYQKPVDAK
ncbi:CheR family methyltransferase [Methanocaldococcus infernus]|uniref:protein-glutamate O-methyltransferase n=1 Tax=Methanocaldococcus infernus (strain DSM 11812 / JCM 15783 / ME) TaxID=573063 RepID=D5VRJ8_METIM|nr:protein-glutamate O-methyltransferase CheR [Methanocaldococcus infernus]ADG13201.1 MCP methyltransferase, CheR-type [Methanocaldococcus infernus ME]